MRRKCGKWRRVCALLLAAALLAGTLPLHPHARAALERAAGATLQSVSFSAGLANMEFAADHRAYMLTLGPEEASCVFDAQPREPGARVTMLVDGEEMPLEAPVEAAPGQRRTVRFEVRAAEGSEPNVYTYTLYRTRAALALRIGAVENGAVELTLLQTGEADLRTLQLRFGFDPAVLRLVSEEAYAAVEPAEGMCYWSPKTAKNPLALDETGTSLDNGKGKILLSLGVNEKLQPPEAFHAADGTALLRFKFQLAEGVENVHSGAFRLESEGDPRYGASAMEAPLSGGGDPVAAFRLGFENEPYTLTRPPQTAHGTVRVQPDKQSFAEGESVTVTAEPDAGYVFAQWRADALTTALVGGSSALLNDTLTLRLTGDVDLSSLKAEFGLPDDVLPSGAALDFSEPYEGDYILAFNPPYGADAAISAGASRAMRSGAREAGPGELEFHESKPRLGEALREQLAVAESGGEVVGDRRTFETRNTTVSDSGAAGAWSAAPFTLRAQTARLNVWLADGDAAGLTDAQLRELSASFAESLEYLEQNCGEAVDWDGGGRLDILLYDIKDGYLSSGQYTMGLTNPYELYGLVGNRRDVVHLDTYPTIANDSTLEKVKSTMAHETQHLVMDYTFRSKVKGSSAQATADCIEALLPPAWVDEGLAMAAEHALFGPLENRISRFNTAAVFADGVSLTRPVVNADQYPLPYLFFQYVRAQGGDNALAAFYALDYDGKDEEALLTAALSEIPAFAGMQFADVVQAFYLALVLQEREGLYGFGDTADFNGVLMQLRARSTGMVASGGASLLRETRFSPLQQNALRYVGVTLPEHTLTVDASIHGTADREGTAAVSRGEPVTVTATPDEGYVFSHWTGDVSAREAARNPLTLVMGRSRRIAPVFAENRHTVAFPALAEAHGALSVLDEAGAPIADGQAVPHGTVLTVTALPDEGYWFDAWQDGTAEQTRQVTVDGDLTLDAPLFAKTEPVEPLRLVPGATAAEKVDGKVVLTLEDDDTRIEISSPEGGTLTTLATGMWVRLTAIPAEGLRCTGWQLAAARSAAPQLAEASPVVQLRAGIAYQPMVEQAAVIGESFARLSGLALSGVENRELAPDEAARSDPNYPAGTDGFHTAVAAYRLELLAEERQITLRPALAPGLEAVWRINGGEGTPVSRTADSETLAAEPFTAEVADGDVLTIEVSDSAGVLRDAVYTIAVHRRALAPAPDELDKGNPRMSLTVSWDNAAQAYVLTGTAAALTANAVQFTLYARTGSLAYEDPRAPALDLTPAEGFARQGKCVIEREAVTVDGTAYDRITVAVDSARAGEGVALLSGAEFVRAALPAAEDFVPRADLILPETLAERMDQLSAEGGAATEKEYSAVAYDTETHGVYFTAALVVTTSVSGALLAYNPAPELLPKATLTDGAGKVYAGSVVLEPVADAAYAYGLRRFRFEIQEIPAGTYTLTLRKPGHAAYMVRGILVEEDSIVRLDERADTNGAPLGALRLPVGDGNGDGLIRLADKALLRAALGKRIAAEDASAALDLNGDGIISLSDYRLLLLPENYGRGTVDVTVQAS